MDIKGYLSFIYPCIHLGDIGDNILNLTLGSYMKSDFLQLKRSNDFPYHSEQKSKCILYDLLLSH